MLPNVPDVRNVRISCGKRGGCFYFEVIGCLQYFNCFEEFCIIKVSKDDKIMTTDKFCLKMANADILNKLLQALLLFIFCSEEVYLNIDASKAGGCSQLLRFVIGIRQPRIIAFPRIWWHGKDKS